MCCHLKESQKQLVSSTVQPWVSQHTSPTHVQKLSHIITTLIPSLKWKHPQNHVLLMDPALKFDLPLVPRILPQYSVTSKRTVTRTLCEWDWKKGEESPCHEEDATAWSRRCDAQRLLGRWECVLFGHVAFTLPLAGTSVVEIHYLMGWPNPLFLENLNLEYPGVT